MRSKILLSLLEAQKWDKIIMNCPQNDKCVVVSCGTEEVSPLAG